MVALLGTAELADLRSQQLTYPEVGASLGQLPLGYHQQHVGTPVGYGRVQFEAAAEHLMSWQMHEHAGLQPRVSDPRAEPGSTAVLRMRVGPVGLRIPVRVVAVVDEPSRRGFAYGTLPGHPERGEESFLVELAADGTVFFRLTAFSRAGRWYTLLGGAVARAGQVLVSERYVSAVRDAAQSVSGR